MARTYTASALETKIRTEAGLTGSTAVTSAEILSLIDCYNAELYDLLVEAHGHAFYASSFTITTVAGQSDYTVNPTGAGSGADMYLLLGVDLDLGSGDVISLDPIDFHSRNVGRTTSPWRSRLVTPRYRWHGANKLKLVPAPDGVYTVTVHYVPACQKISVGTETIDGIDGWERYIVAAVCATLAGAEEADPTFWLAEKQAIKQRIEALARQRVADGPDQVVRRRRRTWVVSYGDD